VEVESEDLNLVLGVSCVKGACEVKDFSQNLAFFLISGCLLEAFSFILADSCVKEKYGVAGSSGRSDRGLLGGFTFLQLVSHCLNILLK
jgi:hypothetical protein